jgi:hypothetical protein
MINLYSKSADCKLNLLSANLSYHVQRYWETFRLKQLWSITSSEAARSISPQTALVALRKDLFACVSSERLLVRMDSVAHFTLARQRQIFSRYNFIKHAHARYGAIT